MDLDATHGFLEVRIEAPHGLADTHGERDRAADPDEHPAAAATVERRRDDGGKVCNQLGASRDEGDAWREVRSIKRPGGRAGVKYRDVQASGSAVGNERREYRDHGGQRR